MAKFKKIAKEYDVLQFTGDIKAVLAFGVAKVDYQEYKQKHVGIPTEHSIKLCAINDYITKDQFGEFDVVPKAIFERTYSDKL